MINRISERKNDFFRFNENEARGRFRLWWVVVSKVEDTLGIDRNVIIDKLDELNIQVFSSTYINLSGECIIHGYESSN